MRVGLAIACVFTCAVAWGLVGCSSGHGGGGDAGDGASEAASEAGGMDVAVDGVEGGGPLCLMGTGMSATQTIGPDGGTIAFEAVTLTVPPGALASDTAITIESRDACLGEADFVARSPMYDFRPGGLTFAVPASVGFAYPGPSAPAHVRWTAADVGWETPDFAPSGNRVTVPITHFSSGYASWWHEAVGISDLEFNGPSHPIDPGEPALLRVYARTPMPEGETCFVSPGNLRVVFRILTGEVTVAPTSTTTYTVDCGGPVTASATTTVEVRSYPWVTFFAMPNPVYRGRSTTLNWRVDPSAGTCQLLDEDTGSMTNAAVPTGSLVVPAADRTFQLLCQTPDHAVTTVHRVHVQVRCLGTTESCAPPYQDSCCGSCSDGHCCSQQGTPCSDDPDCCAPTICNTGTHRCCAPNDLGASCSSPEECCSGRCESNLCCGGIGSVAVYCCLGLRHSSTGSCCVPPAGTCSADSDCCDGGTCDPTRHTCFAAGCRGLGTACSSPSDCCPGTDCTGTSFSGTSTFCCASAGSSGVCSHDADCCASLSGVALACTGTAHTCCNPAGAGCVTDFDCCSGLACDGTGHCAAPDAGTDAGTDAADAAADVPMDTAPACRAWGSTCSAGTTCCNDPAGESIACTSGHCCSTVNQHCGTSADCCAPYGCTIDTCGCRNAGQTCRTPSDCCLDPMGVTCFGANPDAGAPGQCCRAPQGQCTAGTVCCDGLACTPVTMGPSAGQQRCCAADGAHCNTDAECCYYAAPSSVYYGASCFHGTCCIPPGQTCSGSSVLDPGGCCAGTTCSPTDHLCH